MPVDELPLSSMRQPASPEESAAQRQALADSLIEMMRAAGEAMAALEVGPGTALEGQAQLLATAAEGLRAQSALARWALAPAGEQTARV